MIEITEITLTELANEIGVTKSAINQKLNQEEKNKHFTKKGNKYLIDIDGQKLIKSKFKKKINIENKNTNHKALTDILLKENKNKDEQLLVKDKQIEKLQKVLDQQQQLSLHSNQRIEQLEKKLLIEQPKENAGDQEKKDKMLLEQAKKIKKLEEQVQEDEKINKIWSDDNDKLTEELEKYQAKKWFQFWK